MPFVLNLLEEHSESYATVVALTLLALHRTVLMFKAEVGLSNLNLLRYLCTWFLGFLHLNHMYSAARMLAGEVRC